MLIKTDIQEIADFYNKIQVAQESYEREISQLSKQLHVAQKETLVEKERKRSLLSRLNAIVLNDLIEDDNKVRAVKDIISDVQCSDLPF